VRDEEDAQRLRARATAPIEPTERSAGPQVRLARSNVKRTSAALDPDELLVRRHEEAPQLRLARLASFEARLELLDAR